MCPSNELPHTLECIFYFIRKQRESEVTYIMNEESVAEFDKIYDNLLDCSCIANKREHNIKTICVKATSPILKFIGVLSALENAFKFISENNLNELDSTSIQTIDKHLNTIQD